MNCVLIWLVIRWFVVCFIWFFVSSVVEWMIVLDLVVVCEGVCVMLVIVSYLIVVNGLCIVVFVLDVSRNVVFFVVCLMWWVMCLGKVRVIMSLMLLRLELMFGVGVIMCLRWWMLFCYWWVLGVFLFCRVISVCVVLVLVIFRLLLSSVMILVVSWFLIIWLLFCRVWVRCGFVGMCVRVWFFGVVWF